MLDRRRFLALSVGSGSVMAVAPAAMAATTSTQASLWRSGTWTTRVGTSVVAVDAAGRRTRVRVADVRTEPAQTGTTGESFVVTFTAPRELAGGRYRLTGANLLTAQAYLAPGEAGTALLVVNTMRPA